jgi:hypothetical protein
MSDIRDACAVSARLMRGPVKAPAPPIAEMQQVLTTL